MSALLKKALVSFVIVFIAVLILAGIEFALRLIYPEKVKQTNLLLRRTAYEFNPEYHVSLRPNMTKKYKRTEENGGQTIRWSTNSYGFRGRELREDPDIRIIVYGDSNVQARFSTLEDTYTGKLEKYLGKATGRNVEILNAGVVGFGPDQSLLRLRGDIKRFRPDIVIFHIFADNDFGDIIRNRLVSVDSKGRLLLTNLPKTPDQRLRLPPLTERFGDFMSSLLVVRFGRQAIGGTEKGVSRDRDEKLRTAMDVIKMFTERNKEEFEVYRSGRPRWYSHFADHYDLDIAISPDSETARTKAALMEAVLVEAKMLSSSGGAEFIVLAQPSAVDMTENLELDYKILASFPGYRRINLTSLIEDICKRNSVDVINLFGVFSSSNPSDLFFKGENNHWNDEGQDLAAHVTADFIIKKKYPFMSATNK